MGSEPLALYESWDLTRPPVPPRSRLFSLEPVGIGSPATESLTSYVSRLAQAHSVPTRQLVVHEILPLLDRPHLAQNPDPGLLSAFWRNETRALNGTGSLARHLVQAVETLTGRHDLRFLTLLTWADVLPVLQLQRRTRAWCPACYEEWRQTGQVVYEPLLWTLEPITVCPRHRRRLQTQCPSPDCGHSFPWLAARTRPGYCARCGRWLGLPESPEPVGNDVLPEGEFPALAWIAESVGELVAAAPELTAPPRREQLTRVLAAALDDLTAGNRRAWARQIGLQMETVANWQWGRTIPILSLLLMVCTHLGTTPLGLLTGAGSSTPRPAGKAVAVDGFPLRPTEVHQAFQREAMRQALLTVLTRDEQPPPSLREVARRLGQSHTMLRRHLPELSRAISERHLRHQETQGRRRREQLQNEARQATFQVHAQGHYPSAYRVGQLLSRPGSLRTRAAQAGWLKALQELGWKA